MKNNEEESFLSSVKCRIRTVYYGLVLLFIHSLELFLCPWEVFYSPLRSFYLPQEGFINPNKDHLSVGVFMASSWAFTPALFFSSSQRIRNLFSLLFDIIHILNLLICRILKSHCFVFNTFQLWFFYLKIFQDLSAGVCLSQLTSLSLAALISSRILSSLHIIWTTKIWIVLASIWTW